MGNGQSFQTKVKPDGSYVTFENDWFDKGASRLAFKGKWCCGRRNEMCVTKVFIKDFADQIGHWEADTKASQKANELAEEFNNCFSLLKSIKFIIPEIMAMQEYACFKLFWFIPIPAQVRDKTGESQTESYNIAKTGDYVAIEDFLEGNYKKWIANNGYVNPNLSTEVIEAFSHFTYHNSNGELLVCDIQGVEKAGYYHLTDPAIHSASGPGYYGPTDLGTVGFQLFFNNHKCNQYCNRMRRWKEDTRITRHLRAKNITPEKSSSYVFQIGLRNCRYGQNNSRQLERILE